MSKGIKIFAVVAVISAITITVLAGENHGDEWKFMFFALGIPFAILVGGIVVVSILSTVAKVARNPEQFKVKGPFSKRDKIIAIIAIFVILLTIYLNR